jgi:hypothetical protein
MSKLINNNAALATIRTLPLLRDDDAPRSELLLWENSRTRLTCYYAPFEYLNTSAKLILVGITPGGTQMNRALNATRAALANGTPIEAAIRRVKREGSFSGPMRQNIVKTLNRLGYHEKLGLSCSGSLWETHDHLVQFCSLLKFPVFVDGKDYNGKPEPLKDADLNRMLNEHFLKDLQALPRDAVLLPLGDIVLKTLLALKKQGSVPQELMIFEGQHIAPPHPSGANNESIALLLEEPYPSQADYAERMYRDYLLRAPWKKKKTGNPQPEANYKAARVSRWCSMLLVRRAYGLQ